MSMVQRWRQLGEMTAGLATREVAARLGRRSVRETRLQQARDMAERMSRLKGAAMKVGQQVAVMASQLDLPVEVQSALGRLHADADPVPFAVIEQALRAELDAPLESLYGHIDPRPLGTASLAQAHAATLVDGTPVVIKVQHEGVRASVDADLLAVRGILMTGRALGRDRAELDALFDELRERLHEELDLLQEAVNLQQFYEVYEDDPRVSVPMHHPAMCTERVITLDRIEGMHLDTFARTASPEARERAGRTMAELFLEMTFEHRLLHADPHPGNYLVAEDGTVGLIDYGCVKRFNPFFVGSYAKMVLASLDGDDAAVLEAAIAMEAWNGKSPEAGQVILDFCNAVIDPIRGDQLHVIGGAEDRVTERVTPVLERMLSYPEIRGPRDLLFLHRTLGGVYALVRQLRVGAHWERMLRPHLEHAVAVAEGRR